MARRLRNLNASSGVWANILGTPYVGVPIEDIPTTGEHGGGYAHYVLDTLTDPEGDVRGLITAWPTLGTLTAAEDTSFVYDGVTDTFEFQLYLDGVALGDPWVVSLVVGGISVSPTTGHLSYTGHVADIAQHRNIEVVTGHLRYSGHVATLTSPQSITAVTGHLGYTGHVASIGRNLFPIKGRLRFTGHVPIVTRPYYVDVVTGHVRFSGYTASVYQVAIITAVTGSLRWTGHTATVEQPILVVPVPPISGTTGSSAIDLVLSRVGKWQDTSIRGAALSEMQIAQREYEQGPSLLWFLFREKEATIAAGSDSTDLPQSFLRFDDEDGYVKAERENGKWKNLRIVQLEDLLEATEAEGEPRYAAVSTMVHVYPTPERETALKVRAAYLDTPPVDDNVTNLWLTEVPYLLIAKTSWRLAVSHLQDFELAASLAPVVQEAEMRASRFNTARRHAQVSYTKGGDD